MYLFRFYVFTVIQHLNFGIRCRFATNKESTKLAERFLTKLLTPTLSTTCRTGPRISYCKRRRIPVSRHLQPVGPVCPLQMGALHPATTHCDCWRICIQVPLILGIACWACCVVCVQLQSSLSVHLFISLGQKYLCFYFLVKGGHILRKVNANNEGGVWLCGFGCWACDRKAACSNPRVDSDFIFGYLSKALNF